MMVISFNTSCKQEFTQDHCNHYTEDHYKKSLGRFIIMQNHYAESPQR